MELSVLQPYFTNLVLELIDAHLTEQYRLDHQTKYYSTLVRIRSPDKGRWVRMLFKHFDLI